MNSSNLSSPMIRIQSLVKRFGQFEALKGLSFEIPRGQVVGFLGPNGAGKTTTMRILAGYTSPTSGVAEVGGIKVSEDSLEARKLIGYLPESNPLYEEMMVIDSLRYTAEVRDVPLSQRSTRIRNAVERCGLGQVLGKDINMLSKGYRQRVGLAQAILHEPDLLILDEPTSGLDPNQIIEIRQLIKDLGKEKTVILSTHILSEVQSTCSRVLIISSGRLVADDAPERLSAEEGGSIAVVLANRLGNSLDASMARAILQTVPGVTGVEIDEGEGEGTVGFKVKYTSEDPRRALFDAAVKNEWVILSVRRERVSLEETFRKLTTEKKAA